MKDPLDRSLSLRSLSDPDPTYPRRMPILAQVLSCSFLLSSLCFPFWWPPCSSPWVFVPSSPVNSAMAAVIDDRQVAALVGEDGDGLDDAATATPHRPTGSGNGDRKSVV